MAIYNFFFFPTYLCPNSLNSNVKQCNVTVIIFLFYNHTIKIIIKDKIKIWITLKNVFVGDVKMFYVWK